MNRVVAFLLLSSFAFVSPAAAMSLKEAVSLAVSTNPNVEAARASRRATEYVRDQARGRFYPEVDLRAEYGKQKIDRPQGLGPDVNNVWRNDRQVTLGFKQVLFDGFDRAYDLYRSQSRISAASYKILARSESVALKTVEAYIDVRRHLNLLDLARENYQRHKKLYTLIKANFDGGKSVLSDLQQTEERLEAAKSLIAQITIALETAKAKFRNAVGEDPQGLQTVNYATGVPHSSNEILQLAIENNPRIRASEAEIDVAAYDKKQFESSLYPQLSVEGSATRGEDLQGTPGRSNELRAMLVLSWKLFDGGVRFNRTMELGERKNEEIAKHDALVRDLRQEIETSWARYSIGAQQVAAIRSQVAKNEELVKNYLNEYNAGRRSLLDVLDTENTSFGSKFELSNVYALHLYSSYELLAQMGLLLDHLGIATPTYIGDFVEPLPALEPSRSYKSFSIPPLSE